MFTVYFFFNITIHFCLDKNIPTKIPLNIPFQDLSQSILYFSIAQTQNKLFLKEQFQMFFPGRTFKKTFARAGTFTRTNVKGVVRGRSVT